MKKFIAIAIAWIFTFGLHAQSGQSDSKPAPVKETKRPNVFKRTAKKVGTSKPVRKTKKGLVKTSHKVGKKLQSIGDGK